MGKPKDYPEIVYKYRNWTNKYHKDVLYKNHLFLASPRDFNDPFDCKIPINYKLLNSNEKINRYINVFINSYRNLMINDNLNIEQEREKLKYRLKNEMDEFQIENEEKFFRFQDKFYGVLSLSTIWTNIIMWSHYSDNHKGYCVGFWEEKLRNSDIFGTSGAIKPVDNYPQIKPFDDYLKKALTQTRTKAKDWEYEKEYRFTKLFEFTKDEPTDEERTKTIPNNFFAEIILGLNMNKQDKSELINIGRQKGIKVYEATKVPFKFQIDRIEVI